MKTCSDLTAAERAAWKRSWNSPKTLNCLEINSSSLSSDQWHKMNKPLSLDKACAYRGLLQELVETQWSWLGTDTELEVNSSRSALKRFSPIKALKFPSSVSNMRGLAAGWEPGSGLGLITLGSNKSGLWMADKWMGWPCGASRGKFESIAFSILAGRLWTHQYPSIFPFIQQQQGLLPRLGFFVFFLMEIQVWITGLTVEQTKLWRCFADRQNIVINTGVSWPPEREGRLNPRLEVKESLFHPWESTSAAPTHCSLCWKL